MAYVPDIPSWFSPRKAAQVTAFFAAKAGGIINVLRATKMVYLSDRLSIARREHPITGDNFVSMPFGPVNTYTYSYMCGAPRVRLDEWSEFIGTRGKTNFLPLSKSVNVEEDLDELSRADLRILSEVWEAFKDVGDQFMLAEWTHEHCPEWRDPNGSSIPIDFATVFKVLGKADPIDRAEEIQAERAFFANTLLG